MDKPVRNLDSAPGTDAKGSSSFCETSQSLSIPPNFSVCLFLYD